MAVLSHMSQEERNEGRIYFTSCEDDEPPPPPPRPRSNSLPVSGYRGALARVAAAAQAADAEPSPDAMAVDDVVPASSAPDVVAATSRQRVRLPADVISDILEAWSALESSFSNCQAHLAAFRALGVDRVWRAAAQQTHCLWRRPHFDSRGMLGKPCWIEYLTCFVRYVGARGFDVLLDNDVAAIPPSDPVWVYFVTNILVNASSITLQIRGSSADPYILAGRTYPLLRSLSIVSGNRTRTRNYPELTLCMEAPELRQVEIHRTYLAFYDHANRQTNPMWAITSLDVTRAKYVMTDLFALSRGCVVLRGFTFAVDLLCDCSCAQFTWPSLETLRVTVHAVQGGNELPLRIQLPNVTTLEITDNKDNWRFWRRFVEVSCPAVTELRVYRNHLDYGKAFVDGIGSLVNVRTLVLRDGSMNEDLLARLVMPEPGKGMPFPNLKRLHFEDTVPLRRFSFNLVQYALQHRYKFLGERGMAGPFVISCALKRKPGQEEQNLFRGRAERSVLEYNNMERARFNGRVG